MLEREPQPEPVVGMGATWDFLFQLYPVTITEVIKESGKAVEVRVRVEAEDDFGTPAFTRREDGVWANEYSKLPYLGVRHSWKVEE